MIEKINTSDFERVYFVGDIHGEITKLNEALHECGFNKDKDLLVSVGDLIDRGEDSLACLKLIDEPWFKCVRGNHEQMAFDAITKKTQEKFMHWVMNGGDWFIKLEDKTQAENLISKVESMPFIIEIKHQDKTVVVCHANYPTNEYEGYKPDFDDHLIWDRTRIENSIQGEGASIINGADLFVFGHTPLKQPTKILNQLYIDTGACFGKQITVVEIGDIFY